MKNPKMAGWRFVLRFLIDLYRTSMRSVLATVKSDSLESVMSNEDDFKFVWPYRKIMRN
tara:strand:- start:10 stop:186 length:177 start_codon:yes stop_codon:yes gene_type:complete